MLKLTLSASSVLLLAQQTQSEAALKAALDEGGRCNGMPGESACGISLLQVKASRMKAREGMNPFSTLLQAVNTLSDAEADDPATTSDIADVLEAPKGWEATVAAAKQAQLGGNETSSTSNEQTTETANAKVAAAPALNAKPLAGNTKATASSESTLAGNSAHDGAVEAGKSNAEEREAALNAAAAKVAASADSEAGGATSQTKSVVASADVAKPADEAPLAQAAPARASPQAPPAQAPPAQAPPASPDQAALAKAPLAHVPPIEAKEQAPAESNATPNEAAESTSEAAEGDMDAMADFEASLHDAEDDAQDNTESTSSVADTLEAPEGWDAAVKAAGLAKTAKEINRLTTEKIDTANTSASEDQQELHEVSSSPTSANTTSTGEQPRAPAVTTAVKPAAPAVKPAAPAVKPAAPAVKPAAPAMKSASSAAKLASPAVKPASATVPAVKKAEAVKVAEPAAKPTAPAVKETPTTEMVTDEPEQKVEKESTSQKTVVKPVAQKKTVPSVPKIDYSKRAATAAKASKTNELVGADAAKATTVGHKSLASCKSEDEGCKSMCRWLKLSDQDFVQKKFFDAQSDCPLFEISMRGSGFKVAEQRTSPDAKDPVDCLWDIVHSNALSSEVHDSMGALDKCVHDLPAKTQEQYQSPLDLISNEIKNWRSTVAAKAAANGVEEGLLAAIRHGEAALASPEADEESAIANITSALKAAENLTGSYLLKELPKARQVLERLEPIPAARHELSVGSASGKEALEGKSFHSMMKALVQLDASIKEAKVLNNTAPVEAAVEIRNNLLKATQSQQKLQSSLMQAAVSLGTRNSVNESLTSLTAALDEAQEVGVADGLSWAKHLSTKLKELSEAREAVSLAKMLGDDSLMKKTEESDAIEHLARALRGAMALSLDEGGELVDAQVTLMALRHQASARAEMDASISKANSVIANNGTVLTDREEAKGLIALADAIRHAEDEGLTTHIDEANTLVEQLKVIDEAKTNMTLAISQGTASLEAKSGEEEAIAALQNAIESYNALKLSGGMSVAKREVRVLTKMSEARARLSTSLSSMDKSLIAGKGEDEAIIEVDAAIAAAGNFNLTEEIADAQERLLAFQAFVSAHHQLQDRLAKDKPKRHKPHASHINSTRPAHVRLDGLHVKSLPAVSGADDDGDADFMEHITILNTSMANAKRLGFADPRMQKQLDLLLAKQSAYELLGAAIKSGETTMKSKHNLIPTVIELNVGIQKAKAVNMTVGLTKAEKLRDQLSKVQPARDELASAMVQGGVSLETSSGMQSSLVRLQDALEGIEEFSEEGDLDEPRKMMDKLMKLESSWISLKAAISRGSLALKSEEEEDGAIEELTTALARAEDLNLHESTPSARALLRELEHLSANHRKIEAAVIPSSSEA